MRKKTTYIPPSSLYKQPTNLRRLGLLLRRPDVRVVHLGRELEAGDCFLQVRLERADHDEHERLGVAAEGVLQEVCQL